MKNQFIEWIKSYDLLHKDCNNNFFIASHRAGYFNCVLLYYIENTNRKDKSSQPAFTLKSENFVDLTEEGVYKKCINRIDELFNADYEIIEDKSNKFIKWG